MSRPVTFQPKGTPGAPPLSPENLNKVQDDILGSVASKSTENVWAEAQTFVKGLKLGDDAGDTHAVLTSETNASVDVFQMGLDGSGTLREQHLTSADQLGAGTAAPITMNPGGSKGLNQPGARITVASGYSTGSGLGGLITFATSPPGAGGETVNGQTTKWTIDAYGNLYPASDDTVFFGQSYARLYSVWTARVNGVKADVPLTHGHAGAYAPSRDSGQFALGLTAQFLFFGRFIAPKSMTAKTIRFGLAAAAGSNDSCGAAIYDSTGGTRLATTGSVAGKLNGSTGPQALTIPDTPLVAGETYYAAFWCGTFGGTPAQILGTGLLLSNGAMNLAGTGLGVLDYGIVGAASIPATLGGMSPWSYAPSLFIGEA